MYRSIQSSLEEESIFSLSYWKKAARVYDDLRLWVVAALFIALRVAVKFAKIDISGGLVLSFDCYVNSVGSLIYGPLMGLMVGAISDTIGCIVAPTGPYFLPFVLVEMGSSFIFGLFFWRRKLSVPRVLMAKFTVNLVCNIILNSVFIKWSYSIFYTDKAYPLINLLRIVKNLALFPLEALFISLLFQALIPVMRQSGFRRYFPEKMPVKKSHFLLIALLTVLSVGLVLFYIFFLKDYITAHNIKLF